MLKIHVDNTETLGYCSLMTTPTKTVFISTARARELPNLLGRIVPAMLEAHGHYTATVDGVPTLYVRVPPLRRKGGEGVNTLPPLTFELDWDRSTPRLARSVEVCQRLSVTSRENSTHALPDFVTRRARRCARQR
jgi:hypothetical protein